MKTFSCLLLLVATVITIVVAKPTTISWAYGPCYDGVERIYVWQDNITLIMAFKRSPCGSGPYKRYFPQSVQSGGIQGTSLSDGAIQFVGVHYGGIVSVPSGSGTDYPVTASSNDTLIITSDAVAHMLQGLG